METRTVRNGLYDLLVLHWLLLNQMEKRSVLLEHYLEPLVSDSKYFLCGYTKKGARSSQATAVLSSLCEKCSLFLPVVLFSSSPLEKFPAVRPRPSASVRRPTATAQRSPPRRHGRSFVRVLVGRGRPNSLNAMQ